MALYYGHQLIAPDGDMNETDNEWLGENTFKSVVPLNPDPLTGVDEIYNSQFFVNYNGDLRVVPFDAFYNALSSRLMDDDLLGGGTGRPPQLGDPICQDVSIRDASRVHDLSATLGFPNDAAFKIQWKYTGGLKDNRNIEYTHDNSCSLMLRSDFFCYKMVSADWTVKNAPKGLYMYHKAFTNVIATPKKDNGPYYRYYVMTSGKQFTSKLKSLASSSKYTADYSPKTMFYGHSGKNSSTLASILFGVQTIAYCKRDSMKTGFVDQAKFNLLTNQGTTNFTKLINGDVVRLVVWCEATASIPVGGGSYYARYTRDTAKGKQVSWAQIGAAVNHLMVWNRAPNHEAVGLAKVAKSGGVVGGLSKLYLWYSK